MLNYLVLGLLAAGALADRDVFNEGFDKLLDSVNSVLTGKGENKFALENLDWYDTAKMLDNYHYVFFKVSGGLAQDLATLNRNGDVLFTPRGSRLTVHILLRLPPLNIEYGHYYFSFMSIESEGRIDISTGESSVIAAIDLVQEGSKCSVEAGLIKLETLVRTNKVTVSGPEVLNQFLKTILNRVLHQANFESKIKETVEAKLEDGLQEALAKTDICALLHFN